MVVLKKFMCAVVIMVFTFTGPSFAMQNKLAQEVAIASFLGTLTRNV